jgi:cellulose biosynthesis protein BcsQ
MTTTILAVAGAKGGTGRTITTLALGTLFHTAGLRVGLIDADPARHLTLLAEGGESGPRLLLPSFDPYEFDLVLIDCPPMTDGQSGVALVRATGVVLTCTADLASLRALGSAAKALSLTMQRRRNLEFHGILLTRMVDNPILGHLREEMRRMDGELFFRTDIPEDVALHAWPQYPGEPLPKGSASLAYEQVSEELAERLGLVAVTS